ncbi:DUF7619 domain-containing protein [Flavobacterium psychrotrophum]|uniref:DUF7619 domain-containing protein n=1 Tax=Flavobacterium psychrotrophum TaxID=2294119 RepID=UPI000E321929|nr:T9SS type A sorting domain-containing protein [Flavobacterium psychrotrophum]
MTKKLLLLLGLISFSGFASLPVNIYDGVLANSTPNDVAASCPAPLNLAVTNITLTSAVLSWTDTGMATAWEVLIVPQGSPASGPGTLSVSNPYVVTGLTPGTCYSFYVRAVCDATTASAYSGPFNFCIEENILSGIVRYETNGDGVCNTQDNVLPFAQLEVFFNNIFAFTTYADANGRYRATISPEQTVVSVHPVLPAGFPDTTVPATEVIFTGMGQERSIGICLPAPNEIINDLAIAVTPIGQAKPGFDAQYKVVVTNLGANSFSAAEATLIFDTTRLTLVSASVPYTITGNDISLQPRDIAPFGVLEATLIFNLMQPPVNNGEDILSFHGYLVPPAGEDTDHLANNYATLFQTIVNSYDPNNVVVSEGSLVPLEEEARNGSYLHYTINFQNTGTAAATNVRITNTIDALLDADSFLPIASSHTYTVTRNENALEFKFDDIDLPDSTTNEPASHGWVSFRVKPKATIAENDIAYSTANIFFDYNPAIVTNTAEVKFYSVLATDGFTSKNIQLYPNPVNDVLNISLTDGILQSVTVYDLNGRLCLTSGNAAVIDTHQLTSGLYMAKVVTNKGTGNYKLIKR